MTEQRDYVPAGIEVIVHGKGTGVAELRKDEDYGGRVGSVREISVVMEGKTAFQWHVHPKMDEKFESDYGVLSIATISEVGKDGPRVFVRELKPGQSLLVRANTPHLVFNNTEEQIASFARQEIIEPEGKTINFDLE